MFSIKDILEYIVSLITAFASHYEMIEMEAYKHINQYGPIKVVHDFYDKMHTQPEEAFERVYTSTICDKLSNARTGLFYQSPRYVLSYIKRADYKPSVSNNPDCQ